MAQRAVIADSWPVFRLGVEQILVGLDIRVLASTGRAGEASRVARDEGAELFIVGKCSDLKPQRVLRDLHGQPRRPRTLLLLDRAEESDIANLLSAGADALLLRTATRDELSGAILALEVGEKVVAPSIAVTTLGRIGPSLHLSEDEAVRRSGLSPKELEVLAVLAEGSTYDEIAAALIVGKATVKTHLVHIYAKLGVRNREQAVAKALSLGLLG